jgi:serine/threonine protein kinase
VAKIDRFEICDLLAKDGPGWSSYVARDGERLVELHHGRGENWMGGREWLGRMLHAPHHDALQRAVDMQATPEQAEEWIAFEFVPRVAVADLLEDLRDGMPMGLVAALLYDAARALHALHTRDVCHGCLGDRSLAFAIDGRCRLDWRLGFAPTRVVSMPGLPTASAEFMAPEGVRGERTTNSVDVYSLGAVAYAMLTAKRPTRRRGLVDELHAVLEAKRDPIAALRPDVSAPLAALVHAMLERDPTARPTAAEVAATLEHTELAALRWDAARIRSELAVSARASVTRLRDILARAGIA